VLDDFLTAAKARDIELPVGLTAILIHLYAFLYLIFTLIAQLYLPDASDLNAKALFGCDLGEQRPTGEPFSHFGPKNKTGD